MEDKHNNYKTKHAKENQYVTDEHLWMEAAMENTNAFLSSVGHHEVWTD